ncbi:hypothetical protein C8R47DRAFT_1076252 [Mycena vitilis]|nr:hypothetical protein C8R47DRAFT_1076252 [Mycena vitilis]
MAASSSFGREKIVLIVSGAVEVKFKTELPNHARNCGAEAQQKFLRYLTSVTNRTRLNRPSKSLSSAFLEADDPFTESLIGINAEQKLDSELNKELHRTGVQAGLVASGEPRGYLGCRSRTLHPGRRRFGPGTDFLATYWLHVALLGTSPKHRRKGLASALIRAIELKAQTDGAVMCLETNNDSNVAFYKKLGFEFRAWLAENWVMEF